MPLSDPHEPHASSPQDLRALLEQERSGAPFLAWRPPGGPIRLRALSPDEPRLSLGRAPESDICIDWDGAVSAIHAELRQVASHWLISDDGLSSNGTRVAGRRIGAHHRLRDGDRIVVGETVLVFHDTRGAERDDGAAPGGDARPGATAVVGEVVDRRQLSENEFNVLRALCAPLLRDPAAEPPTNQAVADVVFLSEDGVRRCLTRLYRAFGVEDEPKRRRLAGRAIATGVVRRQDLA